MQIAAYCRYSSDAQREASLEDQARNIRAYAARMSWPDPRIYSDAAMSGSRNDRPAYQSMLQAAQAGAFSVLLLDDLSRLSRDQLEVARTIRMMKHWGVRVIGASDGVDTDRNGHKIEVGLRGLMSELYLDDLAVKTHRGLMGQALKGFSAGGLPYGYRIVHGEAGNTREIDQEQARWIRYIFDAYNSGRSPREIAAELNAKGVRPARGPSWSLTAIYPDKRGIGILGNPIYVGRVLWNRSQWIKDPVTGRRIRRERPESDWVIADQPDLRIVDQEAWDLAQKRARRIRASTRAVQDRRGPQARGGQRAKYLFSGLLHCGLCGSSMVLVNGYQYGCAGKRDRGTCSNELRVSRHTVELVLLRAVKDDLLSEAAFKAFEQEARAQLKAAACEPDAIRMRLACATQERDNIMSAIRLGIITPSTKAALELAEASMKSATEELNQARRMTPSQLLPRARETWRRLVDSLEDVQEVDAARESLREILGNEIKLFPVEGELVAELGGGSEVSVVAGARYTTSLNQPFRVPLTRQSGIVAMQTSADKKNRR